MNDRFIDPVNGMVLYFRDKTSQNIQMNACKLSKKPFGTQNFLIQPLIMTYPNKNLKPHKRLSATSADSPLPTYRKLFASVVYNIAIFSLTFFSTDLVLFLPLSAISIYTSLLDFLLCICLFQMLCNFYCFLDLIFS